MVPSLRWRIPLVLGVIAIGVWYAFPLSKRINLGLDLQGGMYLVLKVDTSQVPPEARDKDVTAIAVEIIRNRIDQFGAPTRPDSVFFSPPACQNVRFKPSLLLEGLHSVSWFRPPPHSSNRLLACKLSRPGQRRV